MKTKVILIMAACLMSIQLFAQSEEEIERSLRLVEDTVIENSHYKLTLQKVVRNPYQRHYSEKGNGYITYGGYRLANLLKTMAREGGIWVEVLGLARNPSLALKVSWKTGKLNQHLSSIFNDLSKHYEFKISETLAKVQSVELFVANGQLLNKHKGKPLKPGVLNSATKKKGKTLLKSYSLEDLVEWVATQDPRKIILAENNHREARFNFSFSNLSPDSIYKKLQEEYGIGHRDRLIEITVLEVSK